MKFFHPAAFALALTATATTAQADLVNLSAEERTALREEVRAYLMENPDVILEALRALEQRRAEESAAAARQQIESRAAEIYEDPNSFVAGNPEGDVTLVEFTDYNCPYCRRAQPEITAYLQEHPNVKHVIKVLSYIGDEIAERAAFAAMDLDREKFGAFHNAMMSHDGRLTPPVIEQLASDAGYDLEALRAKIGAEDIGGRVDAVRELAGALSITGTPAFVLGGEVLSGVQPRDRLAALTKQIKQDEAQ